ncbi:MAG: ScyD/ScyE family protein [Anaerolineae bacterium]|nr:ScyD/ScyE family protein [Anaerolineae bacterium]
MKHSVIFGILLALAVSAISLPVSTRAQVTEIATKLNNPRLLTYGSDGTLYIAEAGDGGTTEIEGPLGKVKYNTSAQITMVTKDGKQSVAVPNLISTNAGFGQIDGASKVLVTEDSYWIALGLGPKQAPEGKHVAAVVELDRSSGEVKQALDLYAFELANNPDGGEEHVSNPVDLAMAPDGTLYIVDASANALLSWTKADGLKVAAVWPVDKEGKIPQSVPTSVAVGKTGHIIVGFLGGFPFIPGSARIEVWANGKLIDTYNNLTLVTDVEVGDDGSIYAVQLAGGFGDQGYIPNSGKIVQLTDEGMITVADTLNFPYGLAVAPDGSIAVSVNSAFGAPNSGRVIKVSK